MTEEHFEKYRLWWLQVIVDLDSVTNHLNRECYGLKPVDIIGAFVKDTEIMNERYKELQERHRKLQEKYDDFED